MRPFQQQVGVPSPTWKVAGSSEPQTATNGQGGRTRDPRGTDIRLADREPPRRPFGR